MWNVIPRERDLMNSERTSRLVPLLLMIVCLCAVSFFLGGMFFSEKQKLLLVENEASNPRNSMDCTEAVSKPLAFNACAISYQDYTPCMDPRRWKKFDRHRFAFRERHCPPPSQRLECLVPPPKGYKVPLTWPESRDKCWYRNVPYDWINRVKSNQHWLRKEGELFFFPGGGTMFPNGVNEYLDLMQELIPETKDGRVRTALDVGCGVASWGGALLDRGILTMSVAPRDNHEAQVQFALERGIPAMLGILSTQRLPYPSSAFDIAHCSRCLIHWTAFGGIYLMEIDRVLRPGGFWVLSGPPINYEYHWRGWNSTFEEQKASYDSLQQMLTNMCYKLYAKKGNIAVWQKPIDNTCYVTRAKTAYPTVCDDSIEADAAWYVPIRACLVTCNPYYKRLGVGQLPRWPERLNGIPERIRSVSGGNARAFKMDSEKWVKRVKHYKTFLPELGSEKIRNVMDMNTMYGSFAAALINDPVWVMNVVSTYAPNSLNVVFDRGLIGTYNDWCEAFSTYPRTYDLLHLDGLFTAESHRCEMKFVLLEMDRILRPEGYVIISDDLHFVRKVIDLGSAIRWNCEIKGAINERKEQKSIIICQKTFWRS